MTASIPSDQTKSPDEPQATSETPQSDTPFPTPIPIGGGNGQIAFSSARNGNTPQIFLISTDGTGLQQITRQADGACQPSWSPDGNRFIFVSPCTQLMDEYQGSSLFVMNADGSGLEPISSSPHGDYDPTWSPDGTKIALTSLRDGRPHIYVYDLLSGTSLLLSPESAYDSDPAWSQDGQFIAFQGRRSGLTRIWSVGIDGKNAKPLTREELGQTYSPALSPDGQVVLFTQQFNSPRLFGLQMDDNANVFAVGSNEFPIFGVNYSPDGLYLVIEGEQDSDDRDIFLMTRNGTNLFRLTNDPADDFSPVWRPLPK